VGAVHLVGQQRRLGDDATEVLPDRVVQGCRRREARRTALPTGRTQRVGVATAQIVGIPRRAGPSGAGQLARSTTHQAAQQVGMGRIVAAGHLAIALQLDLGRVEGLLADDGGDGDRDPLLGRGWRVAVAGADRPQRRLAVARRGRAGAPAVGSSGIGRRAQHVADAGHVPARLAHRRGDALVAEALGDAVERRWRLGVGVPGEDLGDHGGGDRIEAYPAGIAGPLGVQDVAIGRPCPG